MAIIWTVLGTFNTRYKAQGIPSPSPCPSSYTTVTITTSNYTLHITHYTLHIHIKIVVEQIGDQAICIISADLCDGS